MKDLENDNLHKPVTLKRKPTKKQSLVNER